MKNIIYILFTVFFIFSCDYNNGFKKASKSKKYIVNTLNYDYLLGKTIKEIEIDTIWNDYMVIYFTDGDSLNIQCFKHFNIKKSNY